MPGSYREANSPTVLDNSQEREAANRVLTGTALAAHSTGSEVLLYVPPPPPSPPAGEPTETGVVQWPVKLTDTDIAFQVAPATAVVGSVFLIDAEYMTVNDVSNADNIGVTRPTYGSVIAEHAAGTQVFIWGGVPNGKLSVQSQVPKVSKRRDTSPVSPKSGASGQSRGH